MSTATAELQFPDPSHSRRLMGTLKTSTETTYNSVARDQFIHNTHYNHYNQTVVPPPTPTSPNSNVIIPPDPFIDVPDILTIHFTGRTEELARISQILDAVSGDVPVRCVVHGMHGIGKSQLTLYFAMSSFEKGRYMYVFWISATTVAKLHRGFDKLLELVNHPGRSHPQQETRLTSARRWLEECQGKWLLVLDNVERDTLEFLQEHLPRRNESGNILFTTRTESLAESLSISGGRRHHTLELRTPSAHDATKLLLEHFEGEVDDAHISKARDVVKCVGCLPLAVAHAGAFMNQSGKNLDEMYNLYQGNRKIEMIRWENDLSNYEAKSVAATFSHQLQDLAHRYPTVSDLLKILAFLDPESISLDIIVQGSQAIDLSSLPCINTAPLVALIQSPVEFHKAVTQLQNLSLVRYRHRDSKTPKLYVHDLIHFMIQEDVRKGGNETEWYGFTVHLISGALMRLGDSELPENWGHWETFIPHIRSLTKRLEQSDCGTHVWKLLMDANEHIAEYLRHRGRYSDSEHMLDNVLARKEKRLGVRHVDTMKTSYKLARVYFFQGRYEQAETVLVQTCAVLEEKSGFNDRDTLVAAHQLARLYQRQGRHSDAEKLHGQVLAVREKQLGVDHPDTLASKYSLASTYYNQRRYGDAATLCEHVLDVQQKVLGIEHPHTLLTMNCLANVYYSQGRYRGAEEMYMRVLASREKCLGVNHPNTLWSVHNLALAYHSQGQFNNAMPLYKRALAGQKNVLGDDHPDTLLTKNNLSNLYHSIGRYSDAGKIRS